MRGEGGCRRAQQCGGRDSAESTNTRVPALAVALIKEIKELRREIRDLRAKQQQLKLVEGLSGPRASQRLRGSGTLVSGQA